MSSARDMATLTDVIHKNQRLLGERAEALGVALPTFDHDPVELSRDHQAIAARAAIQDATSELHALVQGPKGILTMSAVRRHRQCSEQ